MVTHPVWTISRLLSGRERAWLFVSGERKSVSREVYLFIEVSWSCLKKTLQWLELGVKM